MGTPAAPANLRITGSCRGPCAATAGGKAGALQSLWCAAQWLCAVVSGFIMRLLLLETGLRLNDALFSGLQGHMAAYKMPLSNFLNDEADRGIGLDDAALQQRRALFERAIDNVCQLPATSVIHSLTMFCISSLKLMSLDEDVHACRWQHHNT